MADVLANLKSGNLEEVPDVDSAVKAGTHGYPLLSPQGDNHIALNPQEASQLMSQGYSQPSTEALQAGLDKAKVSGTGEKIGSFIEGGGSGAGAVYTGVPLFQSAEATAGKLLGIKELSPEYMALRQKYNQPEEMAGNVVGAGLATYFGGEATLPFTLPKMAEGALAAKFGSQLAPLGSMAVKGMVNQALFSGNSELGKFLYDPSQTVEKAVSNVTLNSALGGVAGVAFGSIPTLWNKTANAINTSKFLQGLKEQANVTPSGADVTDQITAAGMPVTTATKAAVSANTTIGKMGANLGGADAVREQAPGQMVEGLGIPQETLPLVQNAGDNQIAAPVRQNLVQAAQNRYDAQAQGWEALNPKLAGAIVPQEARVAHADAVTAFQNPYTKLQNTTPEYGIIESAKKDLPNLETLQDFQKWKSGVGTKLWNSDAPKASYWDFTHAMSNWEDQFKVTAAGAIDPTVIPQLQAQRAAYGNTMNYFRNLSQALKIAAPRGGANSGPADWIKHLSDPLAVTDSQLLSKTTPADNDAFLTYIKNNVPEAVDSINNAYRQQAVQKATNNGQLNPKTLWNYIQKNWSPETQAQVIGTDGLKQMASTMDLLNSVGSRTANSSGVVEGILKHFFGGTGAIIGHTVGGIPGAAVGLGVGKLTDMVAAKAADGARLGLLTYLQNGIPDVPAFKAATDFFSHSVTGHAVMQDAISQIMKGKPDALPSQAMPDPKGAVRLGALFDSYNANPGSIFGVGGNLGTYLPDHHVALGELAARAQQYLTAIKPDTSPLGPLDNEKKLSPFDQAKYGRALNLVNKPLSILSHIAKGNLTDDDMAAMELYPALTKELRQHFMNGIMEQKAKGKTIPYKQRLSLSHFLGTNLDSSIGPMTMMTLMQSGQRGGQPGPGGPGRGGPKKPSQATYSRMQEGANSMQTPNQASERDKVNPQ